MLVPLSRFGWDRLDDLDHGLATELISAFDVLSLATHPSKPTAMGFDGRGNEWQTLTGLPAGVTKVKDYRVDFRVWSWCPPVVLVDDVPSAAIRNENASRAIFVVRML